MPAEQPTPSMTMYADLKEFGRISNREAALLLLSGTVMYGGSSLRNRAGLDRTFLSREVVRSAPKKLPESCFADLAQASQTLSHRIAAGCARRGAPSGQAAVAEHYLGPAAQAMRASLDAYGCDGMLYSNALSKIAQAPLEQESNRATLYLMLFIATGCLGDPQRATELVESYATEKLASGLYTTETSVGAGYAAVMDALPEDFDLGLLRIKDGAACPPLHVLSRDPEGTVIGTLASGPNTISNVDADVSRRHLRIWHEGTQWLAQGLGSTNGTALVSGDTREMTVVEPPRAQRDPDAEYPPAAIMNGDLLCLGATTQYLVMKVNPKTA